MRRGMAPTRIEAVLLAGAILVAPFIALFFRAEAGLVVMAIALVAVSAVLRDAVATVPKDRVRWLRAVIGVNVMLAVACVAFALGMALRS